MKFSEVEGDGMTAPELVPIAEAARRLGVSADTVRRRLKRGELEGEQHRTPQGFTWLVALPVGSGAGVETSLLAAAMNEGPPVSEGSPGGAAALELVELRERVTGLERLSHELKEERDEWREQARRHEDAARELRILVRNAQELSRALPATTGDDQGEDAAEMASATPQSAQGDVQATARPGLWDRIVRRLGGA